MAEYSDTLAGILQLNDGNLADINVSDLLQDTPVLNALRAVRASEGGTTHKYTKETAAASAAFRDVDTGLLNTAGQDTLVTVTCKYLDGSFNRDVAKADAFKKGRAAYMARETRRALKAMFVGVEKQMLQDTNGDANGFSGFPAQATVDAVADAMCVSAGGAGGRSVWALRSSEDDVAVVAGNEGSIKFDFDPEVLSYIPTVASATPANQRGYMALCAALGGWMAIQYGSVYSLGRLCNIDGTTGHALTDTFMSDLWAIFPASRKPTMFIMDPISQKELQQSRTAVNATGAEAPFPTSFQNVPIIVSDNLKTNESTVS